MAAVKQKIISEPQKCSGCRRCQLICSFIYGGKFNPDKAYVIIDEDDYRVANIKFTDDCNTCGLCASYCAYDALKLRREV